MLPKGFERKVMENLQGLAKLAQAVSPNCRPPLETPELFFLPSVEEVGPAELPPPQQKDVLSWQEFEYDLIFGNFYKRKKHSVFLCPRSALARLTTCSCNRSVWSCSTRSLPSSIVAIDSYGQSWQNHGETSLLPRPNACQTPEKSHWFSLGKPSEISKNNVENVGKVLVFWHIRIFRLGQVFLPMWSTGMP